MPRIIELARVPNCLGQFKMLRIDADYQFGEVLKAEKDLFMQEILFEDGILAGVMRNEKSQDHFTPAPGVIAEYYYDYDSPAIPL